MVLWDEAAVAKLKELHEQGLSQGKIAAELGVTRNTIAGKCFRLGMFFNTAQPKRKRARARSDNDSFRLSKHFRTSPLPPISGNPEQMVNCRLMELQPRSCRFPLGDRVPYLFCGNRTEHWEHSYCLHHMRIVYKAQPM